MLPLFSPLSFTLVSRPHTCDANSDTFRLCEPADEPDVCLKRRYYDEDRYEESRSYEPSLTDSLLDSDTAAVCRSVAIGGCPSYLVPSVYPPAGCLKFQTNVSRHKGKQC